MTDWYKNRTLAAQPAPIPAKTDWYGQRTAGSGPVRVPDQATIPSAPENDVPGKLAYPVSAAVASIAGMPGAFAKAFADKDRFVKFLAIQRDRGATQDQLANWQATFDATQPAAESVAKHTYSPEEIMANANKAGLATPAETAGGRIAQDIGTGVAAAVPAALTGNPESLLALAAGGISGGTSGVLREAGAPPSVQAVAGILLPIVGMKAGGFLLRQTPTDLLSAALKAGATKTELDSAVKLMEGGATFAESLNKVTNGRFPQLLSYQRVAERTSGGQDVFGPFMAKRLEQNVASINKQIGTLPAGDAALQVPADVGGAAKSVVQQARNETNAMSQAAYDATANNPKAMLSQPAFDKLVSDQPGVQEAIKAVRNNPLLYGDVRGLPDNSLKVLDQAKKYLDDATGEAQRRGANYATMNAGQAAEAVKTAIVAEHPRYASALNIQSIRQTHVEEPLRASPVGQLAEAPTPTLGNVQSTLRLKAEKKMPATAAGPQEVGAAVKLLAKENPTAVRGALGQIMSEDLRNTIDTAKRGFSQQQAATTWHDRLFGASGSEAELRWKAAVENSSPDGKTKWHGMMGLLDTLDAQGYRLAAGSNTAADTKAIAALEQSRLPNPLSPGELNPLSSRGWLAQKWDDYFFGKNTGAMADLLVNKKNAAYWAALAKVDPKSNTARSLVAALLGTTAVSPLRLGSAASP